FFCGCYSSFLFQAKFLVGKELAVRCETVNYLPPDHSGNRKRLRSAENLSTEEELERSKYFTNLSQEYASSPSRLSHGVIVDKFVRLTKMRGKYYRFMGFVQEGVPHLHPLEALFLSESNKLQVWDHGLPVSIQQMYDQLLDAEMYNHYLVYVRLSRLGFTLRIRTLLQRNILYAKLKRPRQSLPLTIPLPLSYTPFSLSLEPEERKHDSCSGVAPTDIKTVLSHETPLLTNKLMENLQGVVGSEQPRSSGFHVHEVLFDAYGNSGSDKESTVNFSKRSPNPPDFLVSVSKPDQPYPNLSQNDLLAMSVDCTTELVHCIVDGSDVFFHSVKPFRIPTLIPHYDVGLLPSCAH
ncbi:hypothetical protein FBUS_09183, partial [Fasciolopsis buskii]